MAITTEASGALRDAALVTVDDVLTARTVGEMQRLEKTGGRLTFVGIAVAIPGTTLAFVQIYQLIWG